LEDCTCVTWPHFLHLKLYQAGYVTVAKIANRSCTVDYQAGLAFLAGFRYSRQDFFLNTFCNTYKQRLYVIKTSLRRVLDIFEKFDHRLPLLTAFDLTDLHK
jgi:hypothetical protein